MNKEEYERVSRAVRLAITRVLDKGTDDVFKPPIFSQSIESEILHSKPDDFRKEAQARAMQFLNATDFRQVTLGQTQRVLVAKDQNSFRQVAWLDPFDAVNYLSVSYLLFEKIESARIPKEERIVHSHRLSSNDNEIFDTDFGYDSFRAMSSALASERVGKWKVVTDIANFFDRIGNHALENHLHNVGCDQKYVNFVKEMLLYWAGDRRSFGVPVGSDASRILSEAVLLNVDHQLRERGIIFVRYVDDFRIFSDSRVEALKAVEILTTLLADEGLTLNSRKTDIFEIVDPKEISQLANKFPGGEHERISLEEKLEVKRVIRVSGRTTISRFYREPGQEARKKIVAIPKEKILEDFLSATDEEIEQQVKLVVKYFVYADRDIQLLKIVVDTRITSIFYISDALIKEADKFDRRECEAIKNTLFDEINWLNCAYPLQIPILRLAAHPAFREPRYIEAIIRTHRQADNMVFFREAISLGYPCLDRPQLRELALNIFDNVPVFVQRAIYSALKKHTALTEDEKRPLLKNMMRGCNDWFVSQI